MSPERDRSFFYHYPASAGRVADWLSYHGLVVQIKLCNCADCMHSRGK